MGSVIYRLVLIVTVVFLIGAIVTAIVGDGGGAVMP